MKMTEITSVLLSQGIIIFQEWVKVRGLRKETQRGYQVDLNQFNRWISTQSNVPVFVDEITVRHVEEFMTYLTREKKVQPATINRKINALSSFFQCMKKKKIVRENPLEDFERVKVPDSERVYLSKEEIEVIINEIQHPILRYFVMTMAYTGLRVNECINLTLEDVQLEDGYVQVIEGKGGKNRTVPINNHLKQQLSEYLKYYRPKTDSLYFFALKKTGTVSTASVNKVLNEACKNANITKHVTSHILRHSFASYLVKKDTHVAVIQRLLGHSSVKTTSVYLHVQQDDLKAAVEQIDF